MRPYRTLDDGTRRRLESNSVNVRATVRRKHGRRVTWRCAKGHTFTRTLPLGLSRAAWLFTAKFGAFVWCQKCQNITERVAEETATCVD